MAANPSATLEEIRTWLIEAHQEAMSISAIDKFIRHQLGYRYKKTVYASEQNQEEAVQAREQWKNWQRNCELSKLVFLDETGLSTDMIRRYGRALGGRRCQGSAPTGHWKTMTFIAGLRADKLTATWCLGRSI